MSTNLLLALTTDTSVKPYTFKITNIDVYSFEEAVYHCFYYWKQSVDDFVSDEFVDWVKNTLKLSFISTKIVEIKNITELNKRFGKFFGLIDFFDEISINELLNQVIQWENRKEWEKLKEHGDFLMNNGDYELAYKYYKQALEYGGNRELINNTAISLMKQCNYSLAIDYFKSALQHVNNDKIIMLHLAEAYIINQNYEEAYSVLYKVKELYGDSADLYYLYGDIHSYKKDYTTAITHYEKAIDITNSKDLVYIYKLSDIYLKLRYYDKAIDLLNKVEIENQDDYYLKKLAQLYSETNNIPAAIKCIQKALVKNGDSCDLWTKLALYHRQDYDLIKAGSAIQKALDISPQDEKALLEQARIKKGLGKIKEYQLILKDILDSFKQKYRMDKTL